jgi:hypothetical protein
MGKSADATLERQEEDEEVAVLLTMEELRLWEMLEDFTCTSSRAPIWASLAASSFAGSSASGLDGAEDDERNYLANLSNRGMRDGNKGILSMQLARLSDIPFL